jgi:hypothetical protein
MDGVEALVLIIFAMVPVSLRFIARFYRLKEKELMLRAEGDPARIAELLDEKRRLETRIENLETIVCSADFELAERLHQLGGPPPPPAPPALPAARPRTQRRSRRPRPEARGASSALGRRS